MENPNVFEVQTLKDGRWIIVQRCRNEEEAVAEARIYSILAISSRQRWSEKRSTKPPNCIVRPPFSVCPTAMAMLPVRW